MIGIPERRSKRNISLILLFLFGTAGIMAVCAQEIATAETWDANRPAFVSTSLTIGRGTLHDDYLSISNYRGYELGIMHERLRVLPFGNGKWVMRHRIDAYAANSFSASGNGPLISAMLDYSYGQLYTYRFPCGLVWRTGGEIELSGGALYNPRNSNNPAAAKTSISLGFAEMLTYTLHIGHFPITVRYQLSLPVLEVFFSPAFGESYYEIFYLRNHSGIVEFGSWHNRFDMSNLLTVEIPIGRSALRLGYDNRIRSSRANHLDYFHYSNAFVIGIATPISYKRKNISERTSISAFY